MSAAPDRALTRPMFVLASHRRKPPHARTITRKKHRVFRIGWRRLRRGLGAEAGAALRGGATGAAWERLIVTWRGPLPEGA